MSRAESNFERPAATSSDAGGRPIDKLASEEELLEIILQETERLMQRAAERDQPKGLLDPDDMAAMRRVAQRRRGEAFSLDPIVKEMTEAVLEKTFRPRVGPPAAWEALTTRIAQTIYDDPAARDRMRAMWERLTEGGQ